MNSYEIIIGCLIFGYILLLYVTKKQSETIRNQEQSIKILNDYYKGFKKTCECCEKIYDGVISEMKQQYESDNILIDSLRKRLDEVER